MKRREFMVASASLGASMIPILGRSATPCPPPELSVNGSAPVVTSCGSGTSGQRYTTNFPGTENPISEGGRWSNVGLDWTPVRTSSGLAFGTNGAADTYDDSYAHLSGFGPDQTAEATLQIASGIDTSEAHECELLLRWSDAPHIARGYECLVNFLGSIQIMRWNGALGDFTGLAAGQVSGPVRTGDIFKATIAGNRIDVLYNGILMCSATDSTFSTGNPGIGFFKRTAGTNNVFGFSSFTATSTT